MRTRFNYTSETDVQINKKSYSWRPNGARDKLHPEFRQGQSFSVAAERKGRSAAESRAQGAMSASLSR